MFLTWITISAEILGNFGITCGIAANIELCGTIYDSSLFLYTLCS